MKTLPAWESHITSGLVGEAGEKIGVDTGNRRYAEEEFVGWPGFWMRHAGGRRLICRASLWSGWWLELDEFGVTDWQD